MRYSVKLVGLLIVSSLALATGSSGSAQDDPLPAIQKRIDGFFLALTSTDAEPKVAFDELLLGSPLEKSDDVKKLVEEVRKFDDRYGDFLEAEQISAKRVGKDLVLIKYLYKGQKFPVVWHFAFYRAPSKAAPPRPWAVILLRFDTRVESLGQ